MRHALWHAPLYAWLLLVAAWARRLPILWAMLPAVSMAIVERLVFGTQHFCGFMKHRLIGTLELAFDFSAHTGGQAPAVLPLKFLGSPGLHGGLLFAVLLLIAEDWLRRRRDPA